MLCAERAFAWHGPITVDYRVDGNSNPAPHRSDRFPRVLRHDDLRRPGGRSPPPRAWWTSASTAASTSSTPRTRTRDGKSETILGEILKGRRERVVLASKVGVKTGEPAGVPPLSRKSILRKPRRQPAAAADRLPRPLLPAHARLRDADRGIAGGHGRGGARGQGAVSGDLELCGVAGLRRCCGSRRSAGTKPPHVSQPMYNLLARGIEQEYLPFCKQFGVVDGGLQSARRRPAHRQAAARASAAGHAFRQQPDVSRPLLASGVLRCGGRAAESRRAAPGGR